MNQEEMEKRVKEIFESQGFKFQETAEGFEAVKDGAIKKVQVFSSEGFSEKEVLDTVLDSRLVFVDSELSEVQEKLENRVSVLEKDNESDKDTPSYEMIGDIAVINELPDMKEDEAVDAIKHYEPGVKTVLLKQGGLSGEFRVGDYRKLYGEDTETIHKEFGCRFKVDPTKVYYSERFSTERNRVVSQIEDGEKVLVMFAGVGPYAVMAARNADPEKVAAVEKNPEACRYLKENIKLNSVQDTVEAHCGDVEDVMPELGDFDRIIMPLPEKADQFLETALKHVSKDGILHYYRFIENDSWSPVEEELERYVDHEVVDRVVCGDRGPSVKRVCLDVRINQ